MTKIVGIMCPAFGGSTLITHILGVSPDVLALSEPHWIKSWRTHPMQQHRHDRARWCCSTHKESCHRFTPEIIDELEALPNTNWYRAMAPVLGSPPALVTSDKGQLRNYGELDYLVIPFKDPRAHVESFLHNGLRKAQDLAGEPRDPITQKEWDLLTGNVCNGYLKAFNNLWPKVPKVSISLERLVKSPETITKSLCNWLGVEYAGFNFWETDQCCLGGNFSVRTHWEGSPGKGTKGWKERFYRRLSKDDRWQTSLTSDQIDVIDHHPRIQETQALLRARHI